MCNVLDDKYSIKLGYGRWVGFFFEAQWNINIARDLFLSAVFFPGFNVTPVLKVQVSERQLSFLFTHSTY